MSQTSIDLNCDLGEYEQLSEAENDAAIMPYLSSCNVACGGHAGNRQVIEHTVALARAAGVHVGAHPSYPDRPHFGRRSMSLPDHELRASIQDQLCLVKTIVEAAGERLCHVKPHGALYNQAAVDSRLALLLAEEVAAIDPGLLLYGLAQSQLAQAAATVGLTFVAEGFVDRAYTDSGHLVPRSEPGAVISDVELMTKRVVDWLQHGQVETATGRRVKLAIETLCLHGDHADSLTTAKSLHAALQQAGITLLAP